jgi:hypothetical protein
MESKEYDGSELSKSSSKHDEQSHTGSTKPVSKADDSIDQVDDHTKCLRRSTLFFLTLLGLSAVVAGALTYLFTSRNQEEAFELQVSANFILSLAGIRFQNNSLIVSCYLRWNILLWRSKKPRTRSQRISSVPLILWH